MNCSVKFLVVDDDLLWRKILSDRLQRATNTVPKMAESAEAAWQQIELEPPHVLITDTNMGVMSGIDLIRLVRQHHPDIYIISMFSGLTGSSLTLDDVRKMGTKAVISKDELDKKLFAEIQRALTELRVSLDPLANKQRTG